ncbi:MAG TPA: serine--tRNA ligase, partial [Vicinamibacteria bacterium]|nr:serine--tRNA ligase [Vicinamibacteria bacterium]
MLDPRLLRQEPETLAAAFAARGARVPLDDYRAAAETRREVLRAVEGLKARRNQLTQEVAAAKRRGEDAAAHVEASRHLGGDIAARESELHTLDARLAELALQFPNVPHPSVPRGASAEDNAEIRRWGEPRAFPFAARPHWELGEILGILDFERAARLAKSRFAVLWGAGARLERALAQFMLDLHTRRHGYQELWVPHLVSPETMTATAQLPK